MKKYFRYLLVFPALGVIIPVSYIFLRPDITVSKQEVKTQLAQPSSHFIDWRGAEIHYTDEGSGFLVLMIHGFGGSFRNFQALNDSLKNRFRVVRVDLPGFGMSDLPTVNNQTDFLSLYSDFMHFIADTIHLDSMYLIGNSMGGMMAWNMAAKDNGRIKKMVLLNAAGYELEKIAKGAAGAMSNKGLLFLFEKGMPMKMSEGGAIKCFADDSKIDWNDVEANNVLWNRKGNIQAAFALAGSGQFPDSTLITKVTCPTLIVWGEQDEIIPVAHAEKFHRDIPNSQLIIYNPCGHVPMIERTADLMSDFLKFVDDTVTLAPYTIE